MIKYALVCDSGHDFESWFDSSASFDRQARRGLVACPECQSASVRKALMAPALAPRKSAGRGDERPAAVALLDERQQKLRAMARELKAEIEKNTTDVGRDFPRAARAIHDGLEPERSIRGQATSEEARALIEDGVGVLPLPVLPEDGN